ELIEPYIKRTEQIMEEAIEEAGLTWQEVDKILLVGGSTRTPLVSEMIESFTNIKPSNELNPDEVVALGAAVQASLIDDNSEMGTSSHINVRDVNYHSLGTLSNNDQN